MEECDRNRDLGQVAWGKDGVGRSRGVGGLSLTGMAVTSQGESRKAVRWPLPEAKQMFPSC